MPTGDSSPTITWHTAFRDVIQLILYPYRTILDFEFEHPLNTEPLRIDVVIIKKQPDRVIERPLGAVFRGINIIEYKGPGDYLSVADYHKAGAYVRLYSVLEKADIGDMTMTLVGERYPKKLMEHLRGVCGYEVEEKWPGIYYVRGDIIPVQVIETRKLGGGGGEIWLKNLRGGLKGEELREIIEGSGREAPGLSVAAYMHMILRANDGGVRELAAMSEMALEKVLEECGLIAKWEARGLEKGRTEGLEKGLEKGLTEGLEKGWEKAVKQLQKHGMDPAEIAESLELPLATVFRYLDTE
jgi:hypothetical protein